MFSCLRVDMADERAAASRIVDWADCWLLPVTTDTLWRRARGRSDMGWEEREGGGGGRGEDGGESMRSGGEKCDEVAERTL